MDSQIAFLTLLGSTSSSLQLSSGGCPFEMSPRVTTTTTTTTTLPINSELRIPPCLSPCLSRCLRLDCFQVLLDYSRTLRQNGSTFEQANYECSNLLHQFEQRWSETAKLLRSCRAARECTSDVPKARNANVPLPVAEFSPSVGNGRRDRTKTKSKKYSQRPSIKRKPISPNPSNTGTCLATDVEGSINNVNGSDSEEPDFRTSPLKQALHERQQPSRISRSLLPRKTEPENCPCKPVGNTSAPFFSLTKHRRSEQPSRPITTRPPYRCATIRNGLETFCLHQESRVIGIAWGSTNIPRLAVALDDGRIMIWRAGAGENGVAEWTLQRTIDIKAQLPASPTRIGLAFTSNDHRIVISPQYANRSYPNTTEVQEEQRGISKPMCIHTHGIIEACDGSATSQNHGELLRKPCTASKSCVCVMGGFPVAILKGGTSVVSGTCGNGELAIFKLAETGPVEMPYVLPIVQNAACPMQSVIVVSNKKNLVVGLCGSCFALWDIDTETLLSASELSCASPERLLCFSATVPSKFLLALKNRNPDMTCVLMYVAGSKSNRECSAVLAYRNQSVECVTYLASSHLTTMAVAGDYLVGARESGGLAAWDRRTSGGPCCFGTDAYEHISVTDSGAFAATTTGACIQFLGFESRD